MEVNKIQNLFDTVLPDGTSVIIGQTGTNSDIRITPRVIVLNEHKLYFCPASDLQRQFFFEIGKVYQDGENIVLETPSIKGRGNVIFRPVPPDAGLAKLRATRFNDEFIDMIREIENT